MTRLEAIVSSHRAGREIGGRSRALAVRFLRDTSGATAIEYGLIAGLTFLAIVGALHFYADRMAAMYQYIGNNVARAS